MAFSPIAILACLLSVPVFAGSSLDYSLEPAVLDGGGAGGSSSDYTLIPSIGAGIASASENYELSSGYAGQLIDTTAPVITLNGSGRVYVNLGASYEEQGATAEDAEDGAVEVTIGAGRIDTNNLGDYEVTYYAKDRFGNRSSATRYVSVIHPNARLLEFKINDDSVRVVDCSVSISGDLIIPSFWEGKPVTSIGGQAFYLCKSLTSVTIPDSVTSIGEKAFWWCESLTNVNIPDGVTSIGGQAFYLCESLTNVTIPDSVTSIEGSAFSFCDSLTSVTIGDSVTFIGGNAFWRCKSLTSITFEGNAPTLSEGVFSETRRNAKVYVNANATGFGTTFGGLPVALQGSTTTARKGNTSDGPIMDAVVFFDANLNGLPDEGEPQTTSNGWGDYWLNIPLETYDLNGNGVIDINEGVIVSKGGTDTATVLPMKTILKGPASATVITPLTTLVTRVMEQNPELDASAAADKLEASLGIPEGVDILSFDTFKEASEENPSAADVLTATAKLQDTLVQGGNLIGGATGKSLQAGSDAVMDALARQVKAGDAVDLDSKGSLKSLITEAANQSGANLTEAQTDGAASIMEASSNAKEDAKAAASTVTELATEVSRVQAVSQSKAADDLKAVGAKTADLESTVLAYTGAAMQQQVQTEVVGDFNASKREAPVFAFQSASYTVNEDGQQQPVIQINRTGNSFAAVELKVTPIASSARAGEDFNGEPVSVIFEPLEIRKTLDLQTLLIDDELVEEPETFSLQLEVVRDPEDPGLPDLPTVGTIGLATLTIISDPTRTLTAQAATNGSITFTATHELNTTTTVTAVPATGYLFTAWTGASTGTDNPLTLTMDGNKTIGAIFTKDTAAYDTWASSFDLDPTTDGAPTADPDGDGQNNLFEFIAGVLPNDALSRFHWRVEEDPLNSGQSRIVFSPRFDDRTYNLKSSTTLQASDWINFTGSSVIDDGNERTVIDSDTSDTSKFYRLEIAKP